MGSGVCLITGVGPGTGAALARRFSEAYEVALLARDAGRLETLSGELDRAHPFPCDVADEDALAAVHGEVVSRLGDPELVIHNAVGGSFGDFLDIEPAVLRQNFEINTMALLHLARLTAPAMVAAGRGAILATGNTSAYRGKANFAGFAPSKAAQRILAESMARRLGPDGVHVAYLAIDAVIDVPWTRQRFSDAPDAFFCKPEDIADECWHLAHQPRSAWSFEAIIRPDREAW